MKTSILSAKLRAVKKIGAVITAIFMMVNPLYPVISIAAAHADEGTPVNTTVASDSPAPTTAPAPTDTPTPSDTPTATPDASLVPSATPVPSDTLAPSDAPTATATPTDTPTPSATPAITTTPTNTADGVWQVMPNGKAQTTDVVAIGKTYVAPQNSQVTVTFTKLPDNPGVLTIQQIKLTPAEQQASGSLSDTAYDISSNMTNGSFRYTLTLPKPENTKNVTVRYAETTGDLDNTQAVTQNTQTSDNVVTVSGLNHFTLFTISADISVDGTHLATPLFTTNGAPLLVETNVGDIPTGTLTLTMPVGFQFDTTSDITATRLTTGTCTSLSNQLLINGTDAQTVTPSTTAVSFNITQASTVDCQASIQFGGIKFLASHGTPLASGNFTVSTSSASPLLAHLASGTYFDGLNEVAGDINAAHSTVISAPSSVPADNTTTSTITVTLKDQFGNIALAGSKNITLATGLAGVVITSSPASSVNGVATFTVKAPNTSVGTATFTATDTTDALTITQTANVTFTDVTPPVIAAHGDVTTEATSASGAIVNYTSPTTTDNFDAAGTATCVAASGSTFPIGTTQVNCDATDTAGNHATQTHFNVIVQDTTAPAIPTLASPADGANVKPAGLILDWNDVTDFSAPVTYVYQASLSNTVGAQNALTAPIFTSGSLSTSQIDASGSTDNTYYWQVRACDSATPNNCSDWSGPRKVTIDGTAPTNPTDLASTDHTPSVLSNNNDIHMAWSLVGTTNGATDNLSGVAGYSYEFTHGATDTPDTTIDGNQSITGADSGTLADGIWYFHFRTVDKAGNWSDSIHSGPYVIDATPATLNSFTSTTSNGSYGPAASLNITANYSEDLLNTSTITVALNNGQSVLLNNVSGSTISGTYTVGATGSGQDIGTLNVASITNQNALDLASNLTSSTSLPASNIADTSSLKIDTTAPTTNNNADSNWHNNSLTITLTCGDGSGSGCANTYYTTDGSDPTTSSTGGTSVSFTSNGSYTLKYFSVDNVGNQESIKTATIKIDKTAPTIHLNTYSPDPTSDNTPTYTGTATDTGGSRITNVQYRVLNATTLATVIDWTNATAADGAFNSNSENFTFTPSILADGNYRFQVRSIDLATNVSSIASDTLRIDTTKPTIPGLPIAFNSVTNNHTQGWHWTASTDTGGSGIAHYIYTAVMGATTITGESLGFIPLAFTNLTEGIWSFVVQAVDKAGNTSDASTSASITVDFTAPVTALNAHTPNPSKNNQPTYTGTATDNLSGVSNVQYRIVDSSNTQIVGWTNATPTDGTFNSNDEGFTFTPASTLADGVYTISARATDAAGNVGAVSSDTLTIDTTPPVITAHTDVTAEATSAAGAIVTYTSPATTDNFDAPGVATCTAPSGTQFPIGTTQITCNATDTAGNAAVATHFNIIVQDTTPPVIAAHGNVTAEATSAAGATVTYTSPTTSDIVDGSGVATCAALSGSVFPIGTTQVTCNATDAHGNNATPTNFNVIVQDTTPPTITINGNNPVTIENQLVYTDAGATASDIVDGDVTASISTTNSVDTSTVGDYTVTYDVTDAHGNHAQAVRTVHVVDITPVITVGSIGSQVTTTPGTQQEITWDTATPSTSRVIYGLTSVSDTDLAANITNNVANYGYDASSALQDTGASKTLHHTVILTGLQPNKTYYYRVISAGSPETISDQEYSFQEGAADNGAEGTGGGGQGGDNSSSSSSTTSSSSSTAHPGKVLGITTSEPTPTPAITGTQVAITTTSGSGFSGSTSGQASPSATPSPSPTPEATTTPEATISPTSEATTTTPNSTNKWWYLLAILVALGIGYYIFSRRQKA